MSSDSESDRLLWTSEAAIERMYGSFGIADHEDVSLNLRSEDGKSVAPHSVGIAEGELK